MINLVLSVHRPEMVPFLARTMRQHAAIFLEEPPHPDFESMLKGTVSLDAYLQELDVEYPAFSKSMCLLLQELAAEGKTIVQVEPFIEILLDIHNFFAEGHAPEELDKNSIHYPVYLAEKNATGALLAFYQTALSGTFEDTIEAVKHFARLDAARFRLRDSLRAQALAPLVENQASAFIEAGVIHLQLWGLLRKKLFRPERLKLISLSDTALQSIGQKGHIYGPGDQLTLLFIFHPRHSDPERETILAARSLIYSKLIGKDEQNEDLTSLPHTIDERTCIEVVRRLSLNDCRILYSLIRRVSTVQSKQIVADYLEKGDSHLQTGLNVPPAQSSL
jgi:hypothetical protein